MLQYLFDTDHLTHLERGHPLVVQHFAAQPPGTVGVSAITVEEALRGRLGAIARARDGAGRIHAYAMLVQTFQLLRQLPIAAFDQACEDQYQQLRALHHPSIKAQDLKIAATALVNQLTLVTANRSDFAPISRLILDNWSI
jgi:tRNA(fMet)-specific endonuclease VapC